MLRSPFVLTACLCASLLGSCTGPGEAPASPALDTERNDSPLTLERILTGPSLTGPTPSSPLWSPDSRVLAFRWQGPDDARRAIWLVDANGEGLRRVPTVHDGRSSVGGIVWLPDSSGLVYTQAGELCQTELDGTTTVLGSLRGSASNLGISPDGRYVSFLRSGDLWLFDRDDASLRQMTDVAVDPISDVPRGRYRRRDVEIGTGIWGGPTYAWSPDSKRLAVHHVDRSKLPKISFPHYLGEDTNPNLVRRSYPGQSNEERRIALLDVESRALDFLDLPDPSAIQIVGFSWSTDGRLLIDRATDTCVERWLHVYHPDNGSLVQLWHDTRVSRVYTTMGSAWHGDGEHVVMLSDIQDRYGLYAIHPDLAEPRLLTEPEADVTGSPLVTSDGSIFYQSNAKNPYERQVHSTSLDGGPRTWTELAGEMRPYPSPNGAHLALLHSSDTSPTQLYLKAARDGAALQQITQSRANDFDDVPWGTASYITFPSLNDDATLHARLLVPADFDESKRYPVIFGPVYSNTVRNRWGGFYNHLQHLFTAKGYLVVQVDVRGSTGYGRDFREQFLMDFAGQDLDDLESAVRHLESLPFVDPEGIGIWGSSYGGTLTAYALLKKPGLFDAGVACASAVDPHFFGSDDIAIVRRPDTHPEAFTRGAAQFAENLEDPLLLIHGMQDQVVPFKTIIDLSEALMRAGKDFDLAIAPAGTHGWSRPSHYGRYLLGKLIAHFDRHLLGR